MSRRGTLAAVLLAAAMAAFPGAALAATGPSFSITPTSRAPYFILPASPGQTLQGKVRVTNVSGVAGVARLGGVDATTGQTSGAVYLTLGSPQRDVGSWLQLAVTQVTLGPRAAVVVPFTIHVPTSASPGQHLGGLVAAPLVHTTHGRSRRGRSVFSVNVDEISIVAVELNLPGPRRAHIVVKGVKASGRPGYQTVLIGLLNDGDLLVKARGTLRVQNSAGATVLQQPFKLDTFVPRSHIRFPVYVGGQRLAPGSYRATVELSYPGGTGGAQTFPLTISSAQVRQTYGSHPPLAVNGPGKSGGSSIPVWLLILGAIVLVAVGVGGSNLLQRRRRPS